MSRADASVLAIDPGPVTSGVVILRRAPSATGGFVIDYATAELENPKVRLYVEACKKDGSVDGFAVESMMPYGARVGNETFDTLMFIGELKFLTRQLGREARLINRHGVKSHVCLTTKANDADLRDALLLKFGVTKKDAGKKGSPLHGVKSHAWAALALAVTFLETD